MKHFFSPLEVLLMATLLLPACATTEPQVQLVQTKNIEIKGRTFGGGKIALNENRQVIVQTEVSVADELAIHELVNTRLKDELQREVWGLKACRTSMADPRLGGSGDIAPMPEFAEVASTATEEMGVDEEGDLTIVRKEFLSQRFKAVKQEARSMQKMTATVTGLREDCERHLGHVRSAHGLPSEAYVAQGYFMQNGTWVETRHAEHSVSDGFEMAAEGAKKGGKK